MKNVYKIKFLIKSALLSFLFIFCSEMASGQLVINEVLADPASDLTGDANGDGTRSASEDEFIEFVNSALYSLDISGWQVLDTNSTLSVRHVFPDNTIIPPLGALVLFGGGTPTGEFGGSIVQTASTGALGISNTNEELRVVNADEDTVIVLGYADFDSDMSFTRWPEITGNFVEHSSVESAAEALFSPGTKVDGSAFGFDQLIINEVLADPAGDLTGDANGDGTRDASEDEFIEFVNKGITYLDISGWQVLDTNSTLQVRHVFPENTVIAPGEALVVFGGGTPTGDFGGSIVQTASTGALGISNTNEELRVVNAEGDALIILGYADFDSDMSFTRSPDIEGDFVEHSTAEGSGGALFSPGMMIDGTAFSFNGFSLVINEILADPASDQTGDANGDGTRDASQDEFIEFVNQGNFDLDISGWQVLDTNSTLQVRHVFPDNSIIPAGGALVVFGGGTPTGTFGNSIVQTASTGELGISNTNEMLRIVDANEDTVAIASYASYNNDMSWTRDPDISGDFVGHSTAEASGGALFSPGTKIDGSYFIEPESTVVQFLATGASVSEGDGTSEIEITIAAPSTTVATTVDVVLITGDAADIDGYTTTSLTFEAGDSENQVVTISITDDEVIESLDTLIFELQNLAGGESAALGSSTTFSLIISDNDFAATTLIINEFMAWPAGQDSEAGSDPTVDSNGDGVAHYEDDEFIEFVNSGAEDLDISGWKIYDEVTGNDPLRHVFADGTVINPGGALVVFGGGAPSGEFGGSPYVLASQANQGLGMTNSGDAIIIRNANDETVIELSFGQQTRGTSMTLNPDITGALGSHPDLNGLNISPGTKVDGSAFDIPTRTEVSFAASGGGILESGGTFEIELEIVRPSETAATVARVVITSSGYEDDLEYSTQEITFPAGSSDNVAISLSVIDDEDMEGDELFFLKIDSVGGGTSGATGSRSTYELVVLDDDVPLIFNEIFATPSGISGDANNDGVVDAVQDEFIEVINNSEEMMDLSGWEFHDATGLRHVFSAETSLSPGLAIVVFGGGIPVGDFGGSKVQLSSSETLDLDDAGDTLTIFNAQGEMMGKTMYGSLASGGQSISRSPDISGGFTQHSTIEGVDALFSPGTKTDGSNFTASVLATGKMKEIVLFPNPAISELRIKGNHRASQFRMFSLTGAEIVSIKLPDTDDLVLDVSEFDRGLYLYEIKSTDGHLIERGKIVLMND